jgi:hypothetical protein
MIDVFNSYLRSAKLERMAASTYTPTSYYMSVFRRETSGTVQNVVCIYVLALVSYWKTGSY